MSPRPPSRSISIAMVLVLCAVVLTARLWLSHAKMEADPSGAGQTDTAPEYPDALPPLW
jgi:hypothetical protein